MTKNLDVPPWLAIYGGIFCLAHLPDSQRICQHVTTTRKAHVRGGAIGGQARCCESNCGCKRLRYQLPVDTLALADVCCEFGKLGASC